MVIIPFAFITLRDFGVFDLEDAKKKKRCFQMERAMNATLSGEVIGKYEDSGNHNIRTIEVLDSTGNKVVSTILAVDVSGLYDSLRVGDYIHKEQNQLIVSYQKDLQRYSMMLEFDCKNDSSR